MTKLNRIVEILNGIHGRQLQHDVFTHLNRVDRKLLASLAPSVQPQTMRRLLRWYRGGLMRCPECGRRTLLRFDMGGIGVAYRCDVCPFAAYNKANPKIAGTIKAAQEGDRHVVR